MLAGSNHFKKNLSEGFFINWMQFSSPMNTVKTMKDPQWTLLRLNLSLLDSSIFSNPVITNPLEWIALGPDCKYPLIMFHTLHCVQMGPGKWCPFKQAKQYPMYQICKHATYAHIKFKLIIDLLPLSSSSIDLWVYQQCTRTEHIHSGSSLDAVSANGWSSVEPHQPSH